MLYQEQADPKYTKGGRRKKVTQMSALHYKVLLFASAEAAMGVDALEVVITPCKRPTVPSVGEADVDLPSAIPRLASYLTPRSLHALLLDVPFRADATAVLLPPIESGSNTWVLGRVPAAAFSPPAVALGSGRRRGRSSSSGATHDRNQSPPRPEVPSRDPTASCAEHVAPTAADSSPAATVQVLKRTTDGAPAALPPDSAAAKAWRDVMGVCGVAVNCEFVDWDSSAASNAPLRVKDEIAILPPVSGG
jgi:hypothetical protein